MRKNHSKIVCIKLVHLPYLSVDLFPLPCVANNDNRNDAEFV